MSFSQNKKKQRQKSSRIWGIGVLEYWGIGGDWGIYGGENWGIGGNK